MRTIVATLLFLVGLPLFASPSTLITIPSTDVLGTGASHLDYDTVATTDGGGSLACVGYLYGIANRTEAGIDVTSDTAYPFTFNGKFKLLGNTDTPYAAAVGVYGVNPHSDASANIIYALGSYKFAGAARLTLGGYSGDDDVLGEDNTGILGGLEYTIGPWWLAVDYFSGDSGFGYTSFGVAHPIGDKLSLILQYSLANNTDMPDLIGLQADINF